MKSKEEAIILREVILAEDFWKECDAKGWNYGNMWDSKIAPNNSEDFLLVKRLISITDGEILLDVKKVTEEMIVKAVKG